MGQIISNETPATTVMKIIFDGLASQNWIPSYEVIPECCAYRGDEGRKCAVGFVITDDELERFSIERTTGVRVIAKHLDCENHVSLLMTMQKIHDFAPSPHEMWSASKKYADAFGIPFHYPEPPQ